MAKRKKLSEMTPYERVESRMKKMTWEEAEGVGVEILARVISLHLYAQKEGEEYFTKLINRISVRADEWAHTYQGSMNLSMAAFAYERKKRQQEEK